MIIKQGDDRAIRTVIKNNITGNSLNHIYSYNTETREAVIYVTLVESDSGSTTSRVAMTKDSLSGYYVPQKVTVILPDQYTAYDKFTFEELK